jgi:SAM-dependent methyltransferase
VEDRQPGRRHAQAHATRRPSLSAHGPVVKAGPCETGAVTTPPSPDRVTRRPVGHDDSVRAGRAWWDAQAEDYYAEHGRFLGEAALVWGPEGWTEEDLGLLGDVRGLDVLEVGAGAAQGGRWCSSRGARVVAADLSLGMLQVARRIDGGMPSAPRPAYVQCDGGRLPFAGECFDRVLTAHGVLAFVPDLGGTLREWARVLRPGGRCVFSLPHPVRWAFPDVPGEEGLRVTHSYFDRRPYVEETEDGVVTYTEHHRTVGDLVRGVAAAGMQLLDLVEPEWPPGTDHVWGGWSRLRGELLPGTAILVCARR